MRILIRRSRYDKYNYKIYIMYRYPCMIPVLYGSNTKLSYDSTSHNRKKSGLREIKKAFSVFAVTSLRAPQVPVW
jgi:hypothetical protein